MGRYCNECGEAYFGPICHTCKYRDYQGLKAQISNLQGENERLNALLLESATALKLASGHIEKNIELAGKLDDTEDAIDKLTKRALFAEQCWKAFETQLSQANKVLGEYREVLRHIEPALDKDKNEGTAHPWWAIVRKGSFGRYVFLAGPFFSRESAEQFQSYQSHNLPKNTLVYCYSGQYCSGESDWCDFLDAARQTLSKYPNTEGEG